MKERIEKFIDKKDNIITAHFFESNVQLSYTNSNYKDVMPIKSFDRLCARKGYKPLVEKKVDDKPKVTDSEIFKSKFKK